MNNSLLTLKKEHKKYPKEWVYSLLLRVNIVRVVQKFILLRRKKKNKSEYIAQKGCPFHREKTPSFTVTQTKQFYHCFGCGAHGNVIDFLMEYNFWTFEESVRYLARLYKVKLPYRKTKKK